MREAIDSPRRSVSFLRRALEGSAFIALWVGLTRTLRLGANGHLLLGVPLTLIFQLFVRREPIKNLWVRSGPPPTNDPSSWVLAFALAIVPIRIFASAIAERNVVVAGWGAAAACGAVAAAYALRQLRRETFIPLARRAAAAGIASVCLVVVARSARAGSTAAADIVHPLMVLGRSFAGYFPACFLLEEVTFRGALDSHLHWPGEAYPFTSAILTSTLWGLWHLPLMPHGNLLSTAAGLILLHCAIGVPLSLLWRKHANLAVPAFVHALFDAVRNALLT